LGEVVCLRLLDIALVLFIFTDERKRRLFWQWGDQHALDTLEHGLGVLVTINMLPPAVILRNVLHTGPVELHLLRDLLFGVPRMLGER